MLWSSSISLSSQVGRSKARSSPNTGLLKRNVITLKKETEAFEEGHASLKASMGMLRLLHVLVLMIHHARIILVEAQTSFDYPPFNDTNLLFGGDTRLTEDFMGTSEVTLNTGSQSSFNSPGSCASLLYGKPLQMRAKSSSFSTSFTFSITGTSSAGFAFVLLPQNRTTGIPGGKLCLMPRNLDATSGQFFAVEFDTFKNPEFNDPSNNHVGVNINSMNSSVAYNLCGDGIDGCTYLVYDMVTSLTIVHEFTSWIDYDSVTKNLAVFLTNGSTLQDIAKPTSAIIKASVDLSDVMNDNMFVGFTASIDNYDAEVKKITSWGFSTSASHTEVPPPLGPSNNASAPGNIAPVPSTGGSGSKSAIIGGTIGAVAVLVMFIIYMVKKLLRLPQHFFISLTGGDDQKYRNFAKSLYRKITKSWTLKWFIKVFMDSTRLEKGRPFPDQIMRELERTEVGIVVVTPEYFTKKWPMTELISFMKSQKKNSAVRILPLFYLMTVEDLKINLSEGGWDKAWTSKEFSEGEHKILVQDCRAAVEWLRTLSGIENKFRDKGHDEEYIVEIVKEVGKIVRTEIRNRAVSCCPRSKLKCKSTCKSSAFVMY